MAPIRKRIWKEKTEMTEETLPLTTYRICLTLSEVPSGARDTVAQRLTQTLAAADLDRPVEIESVLEIRPSEEGWITERVVSLDALFAALPTGLQTAATRTALAAHYYRELSCLWRSVCAPGCLKGVVELRHWRRAGPQWICEFLSFDQGAPKGNRVNWHGQNVSQWSNRDTGWGGHQGAIVLDGETGGISAHH